MKVFFENLEDDFIRRAGLTQWDLWTGAGSLWPSGYQKCRAALLPGRRYRGGNYAASITGRENHSPHTR